MALTPIRWIAGAVAGCLAISVLILRSETPVQRAVDPFWEVRKVLDLHGGHASSAARRLRTVTLLDSLERVLRAPDAGTSLGPVRVLRDAALPPVLADSMMALAERASRQMPDAGGTGTDVVFIYDTLSQIHGAAIRRLATQVDYALPRNAGERCVALVHVGVESAAKGILGSLPNTSAAQRLLGPCAYYQTFGLPGRAVDAWLKERGWGFAGDGSWQRTPPPVDFLRSVQDRSGPSMLERLVVGQTTLPYLYDMHVDGVQCASGLSDACDRTLLTPRSRHLPGMVNGNIVFASFTAITSNPDWYPRRTFGRREMSLLADMVRTLGPDRFARFWRSNEPVPMAFEHAAGQPLAQWASSWAETTYGKVPPRGARASVASVLVSLVVIALMLFAGVVVSERRQFA